METRNTTADKLAQLAAQADKLIKSGDLLSATDVYTNMLMLQPQHGEALYGLGLIAFQQVNYAQAAHFMSQALSTHISKKRLPDLLFYLATALHMTGNNEAAIPQFEKLLVISPNHVDARYNLSVILINASAYEKALHHLKKLLTLIPDHAKGRLNLGTCWFWLGKIDLAIISFKHALKLDPHLVMAHKNLAASYQALGQFDQARDYCEKVIALDPAETEAYRFYALSKKMTHDDAPVLARIRQLASSADLAPERRTDALYALGKCLDDLEQFDDAFASYQEANQLEHQRHAFDRARHEQRINLKTQHLSRELIDRQTLDSSDATPIFIVGMPRSGTTLLDRILSGHRSVASAGEVMYWNQQGSLSVDEILRGPGRETLEDVKRNYLSRLRSICPDAQHVVDKMPTNFLSLHHIHMCFPKARIIHCRRNPLDTCLSLYFQKFPSVHAYANDLDDLAFYYQQYERLMAHWRNVLPDSMIEIQYENLVLNLEDETARMLQFCGLDWDANCLDFTHNEKPVFTASNWQVRQPLFHNSIDRWKHYQTHLGPLMHLLPEN